MNPMNAIRVALIRMGRWFTRLRRRRTVSLIDTTGLDHVIARLSRMQHIDPRPMLDDWKRIIIEGNITGVMNQKNAGGADYEPKLVYREGFSSLAPRKDKKGGDFGRQATASRYGGHKGTGHTPEFFIHSRGDKQVFVPISSKFKGPKREGLDLTGLPNNNLTEAQYKRLTGPFGAPRGLHSRIITNFHVRDPVERGDFLWMVSAGWVDFVDEKGNPIPQHLFKLPGRDYRGVRPIDREECRKVAIEWFRHWLSEAATG